MSFRILIIHSVYQNNRLSGENNIVEMQAAFLGSLDGVEVRIVNQKGVSRNFNIYGKIKSALGVASGFGENPLGIVKEFDPNLVIVHNLFPNFDTRWLRKVNSPTVLYHHNYRNFCASGNFFRSSSICKLCVTRTPLQAIKYSCYKNSRLATLPLVIKQFREKSRGPQVSKSVRYIAVSNPITLALEKSGIPIEVIATLPNFAEIEEVKNVQISPESEIATWVVVGRLVEEKGFGKLIENWPDDFTLEIIGDGPGKLALEGLILGRSNIRILGALPRDEVARRLPTYCGAIIPSIWNEGSPLTEIEFRRAGLPIIQIDRPGYSGEENKKLLIAYGPFMNNQAKPQLAIALNYVLTNRTKLSAESRSKFDSEFTPAAWLESFNEILETWFRFRIN